VVGLEDGGYLTMWSSFDVTDSIFSVFGQFFNALGTSSSPIFNINNAQQASSDALPSIIVMPNNIPIVSFTSDYDILGRSILCNRDCVMSKWSPWSACSETCGGGTQTRTREIIVEPVLGGFPCDSTTEDRDCNMQECPSPICPNCMSDVCYFVQSGDLTFNSSESACSLDTTCASGDCLADVDSKSKQQFLAAFFKSENITSAWIKPLKNQNQSSCFAISSHGVFFLPENGCDTPMTALCQIDRPTSCAPYL
jgi:hypothetical protein